VKIIHETIGPIFSVQPWNLLFWQALRFFNNTAMVGNTAIVKRAETVQGCARALETVVRDAGGPDGHYVNLAVQVEACAAVIADPRVRAATVTGSVRAGRAVVAEAGAVGAIAICTSRAYISPVRMRSLGRHPVAMRDKPSSRWLIGSRKLDLSKQSCCRRSSA
jgi:acyl-CoA reductase-like NAD-dependent aldehyde dehydrogenase